MKYHAFISYSHLADSRVAPKLEQALYKLAKPWYKVRALSIYRDKTNLSATPHLWKNIELALSNSKNLIFMASRQAAQSKWVNREIQFWLERKSLDDLIIVLSDGEIVWSDEKKDFDWEHTTALPKVLAGVFEMEPLYVDFRNAKQETDLSIDNPKFKETVVPIGAKLHGVTIENLIGEEVRQHRKTLRIRNTAILLISFRPEIPFF